MEVSGRLYYIGPNNGAIKASLLDVRIMTIIITTRMGIYTKGEKKPKNEKKNTFDHHDKSNMASA